MDDALAGWVSGVAGLLLTQPIDGTLTRLQTGRTLNNVVAKVRALQIITPTSDAT